MAEQLLHLNVTSGLSARHTASEPTPENFDDRRSEDATQSAQRLTRKVLEPSRPVSGPVQPSQGVADSEPGGQLHTERQAGGPG